MKGFTDNELEQYIKQHAQETEFEINDRMIKEYVKECNKATSNIDAPLLGRILTPICKSCTYSNYEDAWHPKCGKYGDMPKDYMMAHSFMCPEYKIKHNCPKYFLPIHIQKLMEKDSN